MVGPIGIGQSNNDQVFNGDVVIRHLGTIPTPGTRMRFDRETGSWFVHNNQGDIVVHWEMPENNLRGGGNGQDFDILMFNQRTTNLSNTDEAVFHLDSGRGAAIFGGGQTAGQLVCRDAGGNQTIFLNGAVGDIFAGANGQDGNIQVQNAANQVMIHLNGQGRSIRIGGGDNQGGQLFVRNNRGENSIHLNGAGGGDGGFATIRAGGEGSNSSITLFPADVNNVNDVTQASIRLDATSNNGSLELGSPSSVQGQLAIWDGNPGDSNITLSYTGNSGLLLIGSGTVGGSMRLSPSSERVPSGLTPTATIAFDADFATARIGGASGSPIDGRLDLSDRFGLDAIRLETSGDIINARFGGNQGNEATVNTRSGNVEVRNSANQTTILLNGETGDGVFQGADCAEDFEIALDVEAIPGTVMVLGTDGKLRPSTEPYDKRVAGIIAGAGDLRPGIILGRRSDAANRVPIALLGRTYCRVDATHAPISIGDLLTTSSTPGLAMKATDSGAAFGAIVGKAIQSLSAGTGLIPILVTLQ